MADIEIGPYGTHINQGATAVVTANQLVGQLAGASVAEAITPGAGPAMHSTAPYLSDADRRLPGKCKSKTNNGLPCQAYARRDSDFCIFHQPDEVT